MHRLIAFVCMGTLAACVGTPLGEDEAGGDPAFTHEKSNFFRAAIEGDDPNAPGIPLYTKTPATKQEVGDSDVLPAPQARTRIRMNLDQLQTAIAKVTGGLYWEKYGKDLWESKKSALGVPDYMASVSEIREPTLIFVKLLGDAARDLCPQLMVKEVNAPPEARVFLTEVAPEDTYESAPDAVEANLSKLLLRYHGRFLLPGDTQLGPWVDLTSNGMAAVADPLATWTAVCVALLTHPDFSSY